MMTSKTAITLALTAALGSTGVALAGENPFGMQVLKQGYQVAEADAKMPDAKCGANKVQEAKCAANKDAAKAAEGKCGTNKDAGAMKDAPPMKAKDGKCGEGKCGANKAKPAQ